MNLGCSRVVKSMSTPSSSVAWKPGDGVSDQFPAGLRVLLVDDDPTCLRILEKMLRNCFYEVTKCNRAETALSQLRENKNGFDIVISDVHMPDMDGFKLLERIGLEMDLPVIMMSADDSKSVVMKGVTHGACDYLIKPVRIEALKNIWQHVVRKRKHEWKDFEQPGNAENGEQQQKSAEETDYLSSANEENWRNTKRRKDEEDEAEEREDTSTLKRPRVVWSVELHQQFVGAVNQLGIDMAVPKKILELMNVPGLTRENVASHLQKYRLYLRRLSGVSQHQNGLNNTFLGSTETTFGPMSSFNGLDLQALAATGQLAVGSLATIQATALGRSTTKSAISMPQVNQENLFSFETPRLRFREGQQQLNNNFKQINLLHGVPMNVESKQLNSLQQSSQSFGGMNMHINSHGSHSTSLPLQMTQPHSRAQILNEANGGDFSRLTSYTEQTVLSTGIVSGVLKQNAIIDNVRETVYNPVSQASSMVDFSMNQGTNLLGNKFPFGSRSGMSTFISKGLLEEEVGSELNGSRGLVPSYDIFSELHQHRSEEWNLRNVGQSFNASQQANIQGNLDVSPLLLVQQGISSSQKSGQNRDTSLEKAVFLAEEESGCANIPIIGQQPNTLISDNSPRVKAERIPDLSSQNTLFSQQFGQDDLMSALLKQEEGIGPVESQFGFDGYHLDNLHV